MTAACKGQSGAVQKGGQIPLHWPMLSVRKSLAHLGANEKYRFGESCTILVKYFHISV